MQDFHAAETNTYSSMLLQLGERYEGDIAFNPDADNLNSIGLIEAYTTVLNRGKNLSIDGTPPIDYAPANQALLLVAARIADFYTLLGNEAYADAQDPMIGFGTGSGVYGTLAPTIFAFQNQLDSLLAEELALLRGRDNTNTNTSARPVYNRLYWNFTSGDGEFAYALAYNITDQDLDGNINEFDARVLYPQGHGDAWGHYLTAMTTYYGLLRHPFYTWLPRPEAVSVAGVPIQVDFLDERKFARVAAMKARAGAEIVNLTYRSSYVEDPAGQWQGYKDTDPDRAWGLVGMGQARRTGGLLRLGGRQRDPAGRGSESRARRHPEGRPQVDQGAGRDRHPGAERPGEGRRGRSRPEPARSRQGRRAVRHRPVVPRCLLDGSGSDPLRAGLRARREVVRQRRVDLQPRQPAHRADPPDAGLDSDGSSPTTSIRRSTTRTG